MAAVTYAALEKLRKRVDELKALDPTSVVSEDDPRLLTLHTAIEHALSRIIDRDSHEWKMYQPALDLDPDKIGRRMRTLGSSMNGDGSFSEGAWEFTAALQSSIRKGVSKSISVLEVAIQNIEEDFSITSAQASDGNQQLEQNVMDGSSPPRRVLLKSLAMLRTLGHTGIDELMLELGIPDDVAPRRLGGLQARTTALGRYLTSNPEVTAHDGGLLSKAIVARAVHQYRTAGTANITGHEKKEFSAVYTEVYGPLTEDSWLDDNSVDDVGGFDMPLSNQQSFNQTAAEPPLSRKIFIVHGHDEAPRHAVVAFLRELDFVPIVLHDEPNKGRTIIAKFREVAADVGFAVVLITPDDLGAKKNADLKMTDFEPRARQNVIFELGFFIGQLGPERVAALVKDQVKQPSDFDAVVFTPLDSNDGWKIKLVKELEAVGYQVDRNKMT